jgi:competence transcription factor ComK
MSIGLGNHEAVETSCLCVVNKVFLDSQTMTIDVHYQGLKDRYSNCIFYYPIQASRTNIGYLVYVKR